LEEYAEQWEQQVLAFSALIEEVSDVATSGSGDQHLATLSPIKRALYQVITETALTDGLSLT